MEALLFIYSKSFNVQDLELFSAINSRRTTEAMALPCELVQQRSSRSEMLTLYMVNGLILFVIIFCNNRLLLQTDVLIINSLNHAEFQHFESF